MLNDQNKFLEGDFLLNFLLNQEKLIEKVLRKLVESKSLTEKTRNC